MTTSGPIANTDATFAIEQFRVAAPGRLEVQGTWDRVTGVDLDQPVLVLYIEDRIEHVDADQVNGTARKWHASFAWDGDPTAIRQAVLHVDGRLRVELGSHPSMRRRLGRTARPALELVALPEMPLEAPTADERTDVDAMSAHAALLAAQDQLAVAEDEAQDAREEARRAAADAERARTQRQRESERLHQALDGLKRSAHEAVELERSRLREQAGELERLRGVTARIAEVEAERDEARAGLAETRRELEQASEQAAAAGQVQEHVKALEAELAGAQRAHAEAVAEAGELRERLESIRQALRDG